MNQSNCFIIAGCQLACFVTKLSEYSRVQLIEALIFKDSPNVLTSPAIRKASMSKALQTVANFPLFPLIYCINLLIPVVLNHIFLL